jgi:hypothetical protein
MTSLMVLLKCIHVLSIFRLIFISIVYDLHKESFGKCQGGNYLKTYCIGIYMYLYMYLSHWYCIYRTLTLWNCLQIFTLESHALPFVYETMRWVPKNILNLSINSSWLNAVVRFESENSAIDVIINFLWKIFHKPIVLVVLTTANFGGFSNFCRYYTRSQTGKSTGYRFIM